MNYYNTTEEIGSELAESHEKAKTQGEKILACFNSYNEPMSPSMVLSRSGLKCPITSIRRAMTNLSNEGHLEKTDDYVFGMYAKREHLWTLPTEKNYIQPSLKLI